MPLHFAVKSAIPPNLCMECGEVCRRPKRLCSDHCKTLFLAGRGIVINHQGAEQVAAQRQARGVTTDALEFKRKRSIQNVL